jgi:ABC-type transporter Mla subunit MlaD
VQIDEVLTALQSPVRADLGRLLESYGNALTHEPSAAEDADQLPMVKGLSGGQALNKTFRYGGEAGKYSSQVTQALTGTQEGDLARLVSGAGRTFNAFSADQAALQGLIDNFDVFTGALANQSENIQTTVHELAPTLQTAHTSLVSLDRSLPPLRTYAIELTPAVAELPGLINASKPWLAQVRPLLSEKEAGGAVRLLSESTPGLAGATQAGKSIALPQGNQLSQCTTKVLVPTSEEPIEDRFSEGGPNYRDFWYLLSNFASAGQNFDGNGPYVRAQGGGGPVLIEEFNPTFKKPPLQHQFSRAIEKPLGTQPQIQGRPEAKPEVRCETNPVPDINSGPGQVGPTGVNVIPPR